MELKYISIVLVVVCCIGIHTPTSSALDNGHDGVSTGDGPVVHTSSATIRGERRSVRHRQLGDDFHRNVAVYKNIPFAEPPVGDLRYAPPVPKTAEGDFDATEEFRGCLQYKNPILFDDSVSLKLSEDCLYLDVLVPEPQPTSAAVMVWIHGGGYHFGMKNMRKSNAISLVATEDVIVVSLNYRLGILGFLSTQDGAIPGNLGLLDQRQGLMWVKENIAAFGGDPDRVTIFGESAGSGSVNCHLLSPMSADLFSGAIMQSGATTPTWSFKTPEVNAALTHALGEAMGCNSSSELLTCLRGKTEDEITALHETGTTSVLYFVAPVADGHFLPSDPMQAQADGSFNPSNVMIGSLGHEGNIFAIPAFMGMEGSGKLSVNRTMFRTMTSMHSQITDPLILDLIEFTYLTPEQLTSDSDENLVDPMAQFLGDRILLCPTFSTAKDLAAAGGQVYTYLMTHSPTYSLWGSNYTWLEDTHAEDIPYVFGSPFLVDEGDEGNWSIRGRFADDEVVIARRIMKYWANFAKTGNPNLGSNDGDQEPDLEFPPWPRFTSETRIYKDISRTMENLSGDMPNARECYFVEHLLPKLVENAAEMERLKSLLDEKVEDDSEESCDDPASCPEE